MLCQRPGLLLEKVDRFVCCWRGDAPAGTFCELSIKYIAAHDMQAAGTFVSDGR